ncbi:hypothetical protein H2O64_09270 [Kordia sp. YSTF-M3]|uniref:Natural product n=1 Tax=Kordia aestuariivivens TaxID=2759037 RepID=A0ABR7Q8G5_9FLAO|nr:hypothetical protein [Kordia aestuariivivens]MBC8754859.1 hypothetical protein [Kordia aestuariivivens]
MKKKDIKSLKLNKSSIVRFDNKSINGGAGSTGCGTSITPATSIINFTKGDCVDTIGDDSCTWSLLCTIGW